MNTNELQSLMSDMSSRTGMDSTTTAQYLLSKNDADGDGSLNAQEVDAMLSSMAPPTQMPSTMQFAQSRAAEGQDELFARVDADGSGDLDQTELQSLMRNVSETSVSDEDAQAMFAALDSDEDGALSQSELEALAPESSDQMPAATMGAASAPQGSAGAAAGATGAGGASTTTVYDELDTNQDGEVSMQERLAGAQKDAAEKAAQAQATEASNASKPDQDWARQALVKTVNAAYGAASGEPAAPTSTLSYTV